MAPNHEAEYAYGQHGVNHGLVSKNRFAREDGNQLRAQTHRRQNRDIHLRMAEKPEQVLPQEGRTTSVTHNLAVHDYQGNEKARAHIAVQQQKNSRREKYAER